MTERYEIFSDCGQTAAELLYCAGHLHHSAPCGLEGRCGKCRAVITGDISAPSPEEEKHLGSELSRGVRLICRTRVFGKAVVTFEDAGEEVFNMSTKAPERLSPAVTLKSIESTPEKLLFDCAGSCAYAVMRTEETIDVQSRGEGMAVGFAADIGTTSVATAFFDLVSGKELYRCVSANPQRIYGADVISRIKAYSSSPERAKELKSLIIGALNGHIEKFSSKTGIASKYIYDAVFSGNTVMELIAAGISPESVAEYPFEPAERFGRSFCAKTLGLDVHPAAEVYFMPCVSGYFGGDAVSGLVSCGEKIYNSDILYADIGTNGEIAVCSGGKITVCSAAAGPAFEGAGISCGSMATGSAISSVSLENGEIKAKNLSGEKPCGICGSGLIDLICVLLKKGMIDETGRMTCESFEVCEGVFITQKDVRELQLAKAAIAAGTVLAMKPYGDGKSFEMLVSGGFGTEINGKSAQDIGLFPQNVKSVSYLGNASLSGASEALLCAEKRAETEKLSALCEYRELSGDAEFSEEYIEQMRFGRSGNV